jgi:hypothetical protein
LRLFPLEAKTGRQCWHALISKSGSHHETL